jgi:hypothetical protein
MQQDDDSSLSTGRGLPVCRTPVVVFTCTVLLQKGSPVSGVIFYIHLLISIPIIFSHNLDSDQPHDLAYFRKLLSKP